MSIYDDPFTVAGLPARGGPSGPRDGVPNAPLAVAGTDGGEIDALAANAISDIEDYWAGEYPTVFKGTFAPVSELLSWDPDAPNGTRFCGIDTADLVKRRVLHPAGFDRLGSRVSAAEPRRRVRAHVRGDGARHEYGHAIQHKAGLVGDDDPGIVVEQQADCFAGAFIRHVAENGAPHFTLNTSDGLNSVLAATVSVRDADPNDPDSIHGSAFERVTAAQIGFTDGAGACTRIDADEITSRRADLPQGFSGSNDDGELPVTRETLTVLFDSFAAVFALDDPPKLDLNGVDTTCADATATRPVAYCPTTNTISVDVADLAARSRPATEMTGVDPLLNVDVVGDYSAYVLLASRYTSRYRRPPANHHGPSGSAACRMPVRIGHGGTEPGRVHHRHRAPDLVFAAANLDEAILGAAVRRSGRQRRRRRHRAQRCFSRVDAFRTGVNSVGRRRATDATADAEGTGLRSVERRRQLPAEPRPRSAAAGFEQCSNSSSRRVPEPLGPVVTERPLTRATSRIEGSARAVRVQLRIGRPANCRVDRVGLGVGDGDGVGR